VDEAVKRGVIDRADGGIAWAAFDDGTREKKVTRAFSEGDAVLRREDGTWIPDPEGGKARKRRFRDLKKRLLGGKAPEDMPK